MDLNNLYNVYRLIIYEMILLSKEIDKDIETDYDQVKEIEIFRTQDAE